MGKYTVAAQDQLIVPARAMLTRGQEHAFQLLGRAPPAAASVRLIVDTGSKRSALVPGVIAHLQPPSGGAVRVQTSYAEVEARMYWVRLEFPDAALLPIPNLTVAELALPPSLRTFHGLIGRDLLRQWESLFYEGRHGRFTLRDSPQGWLGWMGR